MLKLAQRLIREEEGQGLTEYGLIIALVGVLLAATLITFKGELVTVFTNIGTALKKTS